ncbi:MAG TPA: hypothetical protein VEA41_10255 [Salinarimonas sp.]|jgi:hypothetical protein|nr:hypothetical protein [Salinarimonas sp.]
MRLALAAAAVLAMGSAALAQTAPAPEAAPPAAAAPAPKAKPTRLDGFLGGLAGTCRGGAEYDAFVEGLGRRYGRSGDRAAKLDIPRSVRGAVGKAAVAEKDGYVEVRIPLRGTLKGVPVAALQLAVGEGVDTQAIGFRAPMARVRKAFAGTSAEIEDLGGTPTLICHRGA